MQNDVVRHTEKIKEYEAIHRNLWRTCFGDPMEYEDFYFDNIYPHNRVYGMEENGMLHLNPYLCNVAGKEQVLHYIVGVATDEYHRRKGIMRKLMQNALSDMYKNKEPFTYLMPANEQYYRPFDFCRVSQKQSYQLNNDLHSNQEDIQYVSYREIRRKSDEEMKALFGQLNQWLYQRYAVYAIHDKSYFDLLLAEKCCQNGDVIFCFEGEMSPSFLCGMFAYVMDRNVPCVEQVILKEYDWKRNMECEQQWMGSYFREYSIINITLEYPYMIRVVHMESFLNLFADYLWEMLDGADGILVTDSILSDNNGMYYFMWKGNRISVYKCEQESHKEYVPMTLSQITDCVFGESANIYFAEIV